MFRQVERPRCIYVLDDDPAVCRLVSGTLREFGFETSECPSAAALHRLLQVLLELPAPIYHHHRLMTDTTGRKLAKSASDISLKSLRNAGAEPAEVRRLVGLP